jgi:hypothetical protein
MADFLGGKRTRRGENTDPCETIFLPQTRTEMFQNELYQIDAKTSDSKPHLPTVLRLVTDAISKLPQESTSTSSKNRNKFAGFTRDNATVDFTQQLKNDCGVVLIVFASHLSEELLSRAGNMSFH